MKPAVIGQRIVFFDRQPLGQLLSRVTNDTEAVALFYEQAVAQIIRAIAQILLIVIVMFVADWRLAIAALLIVPVMLVLTSAIQRASTPAFAGRNESAYHQLEDDLLSEPLEIVDGMITVPEAPGLGVQVDRAKVEQYQVT